MFRTIFTTLRAKILTGYIIVILIMICVMIWSLYNFNRLNESFRALIVQNYSSIVATDNMVRTLDSQINGLFMIFNREDPDKGYKKFETAKQDFYYWFEKAHQAASTPEEISILDSLNNQYRIFITEVNYLIEFPSNYQNKVEHVDEYTKSINMTNTIKIKLYQLFETNHHFIQRAEENIQSITRIAAFSMMFLAIFGTVLTLVFSTKFSEFIVKPVKDLTRSVKHISAGNFDQKIQTGDSDEIGILADEFNSMVGRLKRYEKLNINKILYEKRKSEIIVESINDPVLMVDSDLHITLANKAFASEFGMPRQENSMLKEIIRDDKICENIRSFISRGSKDNQETTYRFVDGDGNVRYFNLKYSLIYLPENEIVESMSSGNSALIVFSDITKYEELDRLKSEFVAKISHELKTPLTSIGMAVGILGDGVVGKLSEKQLELISSMRSDYERLNRLVKEILELSRIESGGIKLDFKPINVNLLLKECIKSFSLQCKEKNIRLEYFGNGDLPIISADYDYLHRAISNFIGNSIKFTEKGGEISVTTVAEELNLVICISDTGQGISPEFIDKIFDKFVQVSGSKPGSVGLGLTIAKEIVELHQGSINVWSKPGKGSKFEIKIPVLING
jgi:two-component system, NtrC family, sensor histidine kinase KinB